jgi:hypothetical protein
MSEQDNLSDNDPFAQDEEEEEEVIENLISQPMVNKVTYLIHKLADLRGSDFREIQKKCKHLFGYQNLAKVTLEEGHAIIDKLIELTGGEEEEDRPGVSQGSIKPAGDGVSAREVAALQDKEKEREKEKNTPQLPTTPDDGSPKKDAARADINKKEELETVQDDDTVTRTMRKAIRAAVDITIKEVVDKEVPVQGLGGFVLEIGKVIFEAKMLEEASE